jgi:lipopolysaccharide/colanic/teichoic acid biosynthesis glycosyltransferase
VLSHYAKEAIDFTGAIFALILFAPLMAVIACALILQNGPVIFAHERVGVGGRKFRCLKFRTMAPDAEHRLNALLASDSAARDEWERDRKLSRDPRITPLGKFLRETSLDELPQVFNVLNGEMSLVGPRPVTESELPKYGDDVAYYLAWCVQWVVATL